MIWTIFQLFMHNIRYVAFRFQSYYHALIRFIVYILWSHIIIHYQVLVIVASHVITVIITGHVKQMQSVLECINHIHIIEIIQ